MTLIKVALVPKLAPLMLMIDPPVDGLTTLDIVGSEYEKMGACACWSLTSTETTWPEPVPAGAMQLIVLCGSSTVTFVHSPLLMRGVMSAATSPKFVPDILIRVPSVPLAVTLTIVGAYSVRLRTQNHNYL